MSNPMLMASLAGISAGLGRAPARKLTGAAKHNAHIKNLDPAERDSARAVYKSIQDKIKADREAALADFYSKFPGAIPFEQRKIDAVVNAFVAGKSSAAGQVETDGVSLTVGGRTVAARKSANDRFITVCPGIFGTAKADRYAANAALRVLGAGIRVNDIRDAIATDKAKGQTSGGVIGRGSEGAFIAPRGSARGRVLFDAPDACMRVEVNSRIRAEALKNAYGADTVGPMRTYSREDVEPGPSSRLPPKKQRRSYGRVAKSTKRSRAALKKRLSAKFKKNP